MPDNFQADALPGVATLVTGIFEDAQKLVRQEMALARREVANACDRAKMGIALIVSAIPILVMGGILLVNMLVQLLQQVLPNYEMACFAIMGGLLALLGGTLVWCGLRQLNRIRSMLPQTIEPLKDQEPSVSNGVLESRPCTDVLVKR